VNPLSVDLYNVSKFIYTTPNLFYVRYKHGYVVAVFLVGFSFIHDSNLLIKELSIQLNQHDVGKLSCSSNAVLCRLYTGWCIMWSRLEQNQLDDISLPHVSLQLHVQFM
jgi:hypothetical protein